MTKLKIILPILIIFAVSYFAWRPLLNPGFFSMHDDQQIARLYEMNKSLLAGQFPVRWVQDLGFGYGYPLFNFYPPLTYYLGEVFHLAGLGYIDSTKLVWALAFVGSALAMYFLAKEFFGKVAGVVSAIFYLYAPYHAIDSYVRGAQAELFSFVWLPLILLFSYKLTQGKKPVQYILLTGICLGLLMITHNLIFLPFMAFVLVWYFSFVLTSKRKQIPQYTFYFILYSLLCFALTTFFWIPSLAEKQYTLVDQLLTKNLASYKIHFVCPSQLWDSPWGYGGSIPGCVDGLSFKVGKSHLVLALIGCLSSIYFWYKRDTKLLAVGLISTSLLGAALFMTTSYSTLIWDHVSPLWYLQFPWRFLEFAALFSSLLLGATFVLVKNRYVQIAFAGILVVAVLMQSVKLFTPQTFFLSATDGQLTSDQQIKWVVSSTSFEYLPKGVKTTITSKGTVGLDIDQNRIAKNNFVILSGDPKIVDVNFRPDRFNFNTFSRSNSVVQFNITNFPTWQVRLDGERLSTYDTAPYKLLTANIPAGQHRVSGQFVNTPIRILGNALTLITLLGLIVFYGAFRIKKQGR